MRAIRLSLWLIIGLPVLLWLPFEQIQGQGFFALRGSVVQLTGLLALSCMAAALLLAIRPRWLERPLSGLDRMYRLHKWLGIAALVLSVLHWLAAKGPKWAVGWGWLEPPKRHGQTQLEGLHGWLNSQRGLAESLGEWAFYALLLLVALALWKRFPYRHFFRLHRLLGLVWLVLVWHSLVLAKFSYWSTPVGLLLAGLLLTGSLAALVSLSGRIGLGRRAVARIENLVYHPDNRVLGVALQLLSDWHGHRAGQFAFVTFDPAEGPHPFSIASAWHGDGQLRFLIKGLGDYTNTLPDSLRNGDLAVVEGPYGCFDFNDDCPTQVWVAGGIGIVPFIARLRALAAQPDGRQVTLFYCTNMPDQGFINRLQQQATEAGVQLQVLDTRLQTKLDLPTIRQQVPGSQAASLWFCGPSGFGQLLRRQLRDEGSRGRFHAELYEMR